MNEELKIKLIMHYIAKSHRDAFSNMTVYDVAKDLKIGMTRAYELFNEKDFPSVSVGKTITLFNIIYTSFIMNVKRSLSLKSFLLIIIISLKYLFTNEFICSF